jgi:flavodoxin
MNSKRVLVAYYSLTGNTARVARDLTARLGADIESIQDRGHGVGGLGQFAAAFDALRKAPAKIGSLQHDPAAYDVVVVGTPVWVWRMTPAVRAYLMQTSGRIRNVAFFVTSGDTDVERVAPSLAGAARRAPIAQAGFSARELSDPARYATKIAAFVEEITRARDAERRVA